MDAGTGSDDFNKDIADRRNRLHFLKSEFTDPITVPFDNSVELLTEFRLRATNRHAEAHGKVKG
jgi:hypothetical protein